MISYDAYLVVAATKPRSSSSLNTFTRLGSSRCLAKHAGVVCRGRVRYSERFAVRYISVLTSIVDDLKTLLLVRQGTGGICKKEV